MDNRRKLELQLALKRKKLKPIKITKGDKTTTTPTTKYDMEASDVIKSPLELAKEIGPAATQRLKEAREMGSFKKTMVHAGRTVDKLGAGAADIGDFIAYVAGDEGQAILIARV